LTVAEDVARMIKRIIDANWWNSSKVKRW
jgi:hypothetical protein